jgi:LysR family transcriptional regulator, regulator of abg operon
MPRGSLMSAIDFRRVMHFLTVVECRSVGDAARRLHISQPALTKSIHDLEQSLGTQLFERSRTGMTVNQYGQLLKQRATTIAVEAACAEAEIGQMLGAMRGIVKMSVSPSFASTLLPPALARFRASHPDVEITAVEDTTDIAAPRIRDGALDFAIGTVSPGMALEGLHTQLLYREQVVVVASSANPITSRRRVSAREAWPGPWLMGSGSVFRTRMIELFAQADLPPPQAAVSYSSVSFARSILPHSNYLCMLSVTAIREQVEAGSLRVVRAPELTWERNVGVVSRDRDSLMPAARSLLDTICVACAETNRKRPIAHRHRRT